MYIPEELKKVNQFIDVAIPSNKSYFARVGEIAPSSSQFTGEDLAIMNQDKIDQIVDYSKYAESMADAESVKSE